MALWTALPRFRGESSQRTWVYRVAHNTAISFAAQQRRRGQREQPVEPAAEPGVPGESGRGRDRTNSAARSCGPPCRRSRSPTGR